MATFTEDQFAQLIALISGQLQAASGRAEAGIGHGRRMLETKWFSRVDKFEGGEEKWKEWMFDFKVAVKAQNEKVERAMRMIERSVLLMMES